MAASKFVAAETSTNPPSSEKVSVGRQVLRRQINDRVSARQADRSEFDVLCECGRAGCRDRRLVPRDVYEKLRRVPTQFLVKQSHAAPVERKVGAHEDFLIVERLDHDSRKGNRARAGRARSSEGGDGLADDEPELPVQRRSGQQDEDAPMAREQTSWFARELGEEWQEEEAGIFRHVGANHGRATP